MFVGSPQNDMQKLQTYLQTVPTPEAASAMVSVFEALSVLDETVARHEPLTGENIYIGCLNKVHFAVETKRFKEIAAIGLS